MTCEALEVTGLMRAFDFDAFFGDRVAVLGSNGSSKSHFLRLLAAGGTDPEPGQEPVSDAGIEPVPHAGAPTSTGAPSDETAPHSHQPPSAHSAHRSGPRGPQQQHHRPVGFREFSVRRFSCAAVGNTPARC